jgi:hypothetical protein
VDFGCCAQTEPYWGPPSRENIWLSSVGQGRPGAEDAGSIQHPLWMRSGLHWADGRSIDTKMKEHQRHTRPSHGNLSSTPWSNVGSLHHITPDLSSLRGHAGPCSLPLSGYKLCPLRALTSLHPDVLASSATSVPSFNTAWLRLARLAFSPHTSIPCPT